MDAMEAILTRRSVRQYTGAKISEDTIKLLLEATMSAPSAGNQQPWQIIVIDDRQVLNAITEVHPYASMLKQAALGIVICGDLQRETFKGYWVQDCSAATENLLIAARALGLGAVWLGVYPLKDRIKGIGKLLHLPDTVIPLAVVSIGYPAVEQGAVNRFDSRRIHRNRWGSRMF